MKLQNYSMHGVAKKKSMELQKKFNGVAQQFNGIAKQFNEVKTIQ